MVDTAEVASALKTDAKVLRRFLRSPASPIKAVGSGSRYRITQADLPMLQEAFKKWAKGRPNTIAPKPRTAPETVDAIEDQRRRDEEVWAEEEAKRGPIILEDIRDPRVRAKVRAKAQRQEDRLEALLLAHGLHITQQRRSS